jgi:hypothetical protein
VAVLLVLLLLMERLRALVGVGGYDVDGRGRCDLKLKVDAIEQVHVVVQLRLFVVEQVPVVVLHLVAEAHHAVGQHRHLHHHPHHTIFSSNSHFNRITKLDGGEERERRERERELSLTCWRSAEVDVSRLEVAV